MEMSISSQPKKHPFTLTHPTSTGFTQTFQFTWDDWNFRQKKNVTAMATAVLISKLLHGRKEKKKSDGKITKYKLYMNTMRWIHKRINKLTNASSWKLKKTKKQAKHLSEKHLHVCCILYGRLVMNIDWSDAAVQCWSNTNYPSCYVCLQKGATQWGVWVQWWTTWLVGEPWSEDHGV